MKIKVIVEAVIIGACIAGIVVLMNGCSSTRALYHACRDGLCR